MPQHLTKDMEDKILSMYAKGMTTGDIESHMEEFYGVNISDSTKYVSYKELRPLMTDLKRCMPP